MIKWYIENEKREFLGCFDRCNDVWTMDPDLAMRWDDIDFLFGDGRWYRVTDGHLYLLEFQRDGKLSGCNMVKHDFQPVMMNVQEHTLLLRDTLTKDIWSRTYGPLDRVFFETMLANSSILPSTSVDFLSGSI